MHYNKTLMVVEDEEKLLRTLSDFLTIQGYEILQASDGQEALEIFCNNMNKIDLVLLDIKLPLVNGNEVLNEIRRNSGDYADCEFLCGKTAVQFFTGR